MSRLLEIMVGIESYQIPQHHGHVLIDVQLDTFDNIISCKRSDPHKDKDNSRIFFNSVNFAEALILGMIAPVQSFFAPRTDILFSGLEYENIRLARTTLITTKFIDRCLEEADEVFKFSEEPINRINSAIERSQWEERISRKIYCIYQLDSLLKMIKDIDLPGEPLDFTSMPDVKYMNRHIDSIKKEIESIRKMHKNFLDEQFLFRTLHSEHINIYHSKALVL